jgi:hypothetical protein
MRRTAKPVRRCNRCLLNLGDHCWYFESPRDQWKGGDCEGFENQALYKEYEEWKNRPQIKTRHELRRTMSLSRKKPAFPKNRNPNWKE